MQSELLGLLSGVDVNLGTLFILIAAVGSFGYSIAKFVSWVIKLYQNKISSVRKNSVDEYKDQEEEDDLRATVSNLVADMEKVNAKLDNLATTIANQSKDSKETVDNLTDALKKERDKRDAREDKLHTEIDGLVRQSNETREVINKLTVDVTNLTDSEASRIRSFITEQYHKYVPIGEIDALTLAAIKDEFIKYDKVFHKNTFVHGCMEALQKLKIVTSTPTTSEELLHYIDMYTQIFSGGIPETIDDQSNK